MIAKGSTRYILGMATIVIIAILIFFLAVPHVDRKIQGEVGPWYKFWLQTLAGNWSSGEDSTSLISRGIITNREFAASAVFGVLLNNFVFVIIITAIWKLFAQGKKTMRMADALILKEFYIKEALREALQTRLSEVFSRAGKSGTVPENWLGDDIIDNLLENSFEKGQIELEAKLPIIADSEEEADSILAMIKTRQSASSANRPNYR